MDTHPGAVEIESNVALAFGEAHGPPRSPLKRGAPRPLVAPQGLPPQQRLRANKIVRGST